MFARIPITPVENDRILAVTKERSRWFEHNHNFRIRFSRQDFLQYLVAERALNIGVETKKLLDPLNEHLAKIQLVLPPDFFQGAFLSEARTKKGEWFLNMRYFGPDARHPFGPKEKFIFRHRLPPWVVPQLATIGTRGLRALSHLVLDGLRRLIIHEVEEGFLIGKRRFINAHRSPNNPRRRK